MPSSDGSVTRIGGRDFAWGARTYVMGIVNVSPDSFSGDGVADREAAVAQGLRMVEEGADIIDVGGQSTRPDFEEISVEEEMARVIPPIEALAARTDTPISVDTYRARVAAAAFEAGAALLNDIWGLRRDAGLALLLGRAARPAVLMHNQRGREAKEVIGDIRHGLRASLAVAAAAGVPREQLILDPGFGFGWTPAENLEILRRLAELRDLGRPLLVGTSRKSTIGAVLDLPADQRLYGTAATVALAIANGADLVRVHDVAAMLQVCRMADAVVRGSWRAP
jgi:dihydropteroate synthase